MKWPLFLAVADMHQQILRLPIPQPVPKRREVETEISPTVVIDLWGEEDDELGSGSYQQDLFDGGLSIGGGRED